MNILIVTSSWFQSGGDWTYVDSICKIYESHGHNIIPFSMLDEKNFKTNFDKYFLSNINYNELNKQKSLKNSLKVISRSIYSNEAVSKLNLLLDDNKIDIAQLNNIHNIHTPAIISVLKKRNIPIVWRVLDYKIICPNRSFLSNQRICEDCFKTKYYNCFFNKCKKNSYSASFITMVESYFNKLLPFYNNVDYFLFQSEFSRNLFVKFGFDVNKTRIIENPYNCNGIFPQYEGEKNEKKRYILYFGRISREKGIFTLYDAMKLIPSINLKIIGNGPDFDSSIKYINDYNINNIEILGPKWGDSLSPYIRNCEFTVLPSEWYEPNPYVVLQSFSYGKPVVANAIGGLNDMITENKTGMFCKVKDPVDLSNVILELFYNKEKITYLGKNAREIVEHKYSPEIYYKSTMNLFNELIILNN